MASGVSLSKGAWLGGTVVVGRVVPAVGGSHRFGLVRTMQRKGPAVNADNDVVASRVSQRKTRRRRGERLLSYRGRHEKDGETRSLDRVFNGSEKKLTKAWLVKYESRTGGFRSETS